MTKPKLNEPMDEFTRAIIKQRLVVTLDEFPNKLKLGTFQLSEFLIKFGHILRELSHSLDKTTAERAIYGEDLRTLYKLGDEFWQIGMDMERQRPRNARKQVTLEVLAARLEQLERSAR